MRRFKFYRRKKVGYWIRAKHRGWITQSEHAFYIGYGFDPVMIEEEFYLPKDKIFDVRSEIGHLKFKTDYWL